RPGRKCMSIVIIRPTQPLRQAAPVRFELPAGTLAGGNLALVDEETGTRFPVQRDAEGGRVPAQRVDAFWPRQRTAPGAGPRALATAVAVIGPIDAERRYRIESSPAGG